VTGIDYRFSGLMRIQLVDPRDTVSLVRNPLLRIEGVVEIPVVDKLLRGEGGDHNG